jgi:hypothetical protein
MSIINFRQTLSAPPLFQVNYVELVYKFRINASYLEAFKTPSVLAYPSIGEQLSQWDQCNIGP